MASASNPTADLLLSHVSWLRGLARQLVSDHDLAEDLAQEACVVALERSPRDAKKIRRWLASILRNLLRQRVRGEGRRRAREALQARDDWSEPAALVVEKIHTQRHLVELVLELPEPYRASVLLRFFEGLPPREIGRRMGVPATTVQSRLTRGLARLRERLDAEHGHGERTWMALLWPLADGGRGAGLLDVGSWILSTKLALAGAALLIAGTVFALAQGASVGRAGSQPARVGLAPVVTSPWPVETSAGGTTLGGVAGAPTRAVARRVAELPLPAAKDRRGGGLRVRGRVLDARGQPVAGVRVACVESSVPGAASNTGAPAVEGASRASHGPEARSGGNGWFELETSARRGRLEVRDAAYVTVRAGTWHAAAAFDPVVVIAPAVELAGTVVDELGRGLGGASVALRLPSDFPARMGTVLDATRIRTWTATTSDAGRFALARAPAVAGAKLVSVLDGYALAMKDVPAYTDLGLRIQLARPTPAPRAALRGQVVHADGRPAPGARVGLGLGSALADAAGRFELDLRYALAAETLIAVLPGYMPARSERPDASPRPEAGVRAWPEWTVLRLGGPALSIAGIVLDHSGRPQAGVRVWPAHPTPFGAIGRTPAHVEALMAGAPVPPGALALPLPAVDGDEFTDFVSPARRATQSPLWSWATTDEQGRFELAGLLDRRYRLRAMAEDSMLLETSAPIAAGARGIVVQLPPPNVAGKVAGQVVLAGAGPLEGVEVTEWLPVVDVTARVFGGTTQFVFTQLGRTVTTDADGRFVFENVVCPGLRLALRSDHILPTEHSLDQEPDPRSIEIVVDARCHLMVELRENVRRADSIEARAADGERLEILVLTGASTDALFALPLVAGRSEVFSVSPRTREIVLFLAGEEVTSVRVLPRPGEVTRISL